MLAASGAWARCGRELASGRVADGATEDSERASARTDAGVRRDDEASTLRLLCCKANMSRTRCTEIEEEKRERERHEET